MLEGPLKGGSSSTRSWRLVAALGAVLATASCASVDSDQARICRVAIPALEPAGSRIAVIRTRPAPSGVRVDYRATPPAGETRAGFAHCRFAPGLRRELVAITTNRGEIAGATVYLLNRHYIDTPEGIAGDPGPPAAEADLPEIPAAAAGLLQHVLAGLPGLSVYGLLAAAYGLVYGLVGRINLAFGEIAAVGAAAIGLVVAGLAGSGAAGGALGLAAGLVAAVIAAGLHGSVAARLAFVAVPARMGQASLIATVGLSLALSEYLRLAQGSARSWIPAVGADLLPLARAGGFVVVATPMTLATAGLGFAAAGALAVAMRRSRFGRHWRALADEPVAAALCGLDTGRTLALTFALSGGLAGLAGALVAARFGALGFADGFSLGLKALAGAILGGIGSVPAALAGGLAIGAFEILWSAWLPLAWRDVALYLALAGAISCRPEGLARRPQAGGG